MMFHRFAVIASMVVLSAAIVSAALRPLAKFEPPDGVTYHGVCLTGYWSDADFDKHLKAYQTAVPDKPVALYSMFAHCMENGHWNTWRWTKPTPDDNWGNGVVANIERARARGFVPVVAWTWMDWHQMKNSPRLQDVPTGKYDWYLDDWIKGLKEYQSPIFIRLSHEMDGDWYPYSEGYKPDPTRNTTDDFVKYWRYVVDRFRKAGVDNVAWVWCVNGDRSGGKDWPDYYPGDEYVDWLAIDLYSARNPRDVIKQFLDLYGKTGKPIMIPEGGTGEEQTRWNPKFAGNAAWTKEFFDVIDETLRLRRFAGSSGTKSGASPATRLSSPNSGGGSPKSDLPGNSSAPIPYVERAAGMNGTFHTPKSLMHSSPVQKFDSPLRREEDHAVDSSREEIETPRHGGG